MKAIKVEVSEEECIKLGSLVSYLNDGDVFAYQTNRTTFIAVTAGETSMAYVQTIIAARLSDEIEITDLRR